VTPPKPTFDHTHSAELMAEARRYAPGGIHTSLRKLPVDIVFSRSQGAYMWDVDGNRYIDYHAAFGPLVLGHNHPRVNQAVIEAMQQLDLIGTGAHEYEITVCRKIVEHVPSAEMVGLVNSGSEATHHAIRLARAATGRLDLLKFQGCYHGWHDYLLMNIISPAEKLGHKDPASAGMLPEALEHTSVVDFNDLAAVEAALSTRRYAAVILEPIPHNIGCVLPTDEFAQGLRRVCNETGTVLIFDEVVTGFRHGIGGFQAKLGVTPDLTTLAKAIANGYPCAAVAGKRDLMMLSATAGGPVFFAGTYNGHPVGTAAAAATITELETGEVYRHTFGLGDYARDNLTEIASRVGIPMLVTGYGSVFVPYFMDPDKGLPQNFTDLLGNDNQRDQAFRLAMVERGFFMVPTAMKRNHISAAHTKEDIDCTLEAAEDVLRSLA
jgi:glutamate-1-semialdehyde 2,1-aminomutase